MLRFEEEVVNALCTRSDPSERAVVRAWVDDSLTVMPEVLRGGVALGSVVLGAWYGLTRRHGDDLIAALSRSPLPPVRQHLRLLRSLVLFGDLELAAAR